MMLLPTCTSHGIVSVSGFLQMFMQFNFSYRKFQERIKKQCIIT